MPEFTFSAHAEIVMLERAIPVKWVERVLANPDRVERDNSDECLRHALGRVPEHGNRVLRVVYNEQVEPLRIVTVYFDRALRNKL